MPIAVETVQGTKALGCWTLEGYPSTMLFSPPFSSVGSDLMVSVEYLSEGSSGDSYLRFKPTEPNNEAFDVGKLAATNGKWATCEFRLDGKGTATGFLEFHPGSIELGKHFWIKSITVTGG